MLGVLELVHGPLGVARPLELTGVQDTGDIHGSKDVGLLGLADVGPFRRAQPDPHALAVADDPFLHVLCYAGIGMPADAFRRLHVDPTVGPREHGHEVPQVDGAEEGLAKLDWWPGGAPYA